jgi:hypothetical protein
MPLITGNILEARMAYSALEALAAGAEQNAALLQATVANLAAIPAEQAVRSQVLHDFVVNQAAANSQLVADQAAQVSPDVSLEGFIASLGLAVALAEASMPDRTINSVKAVVQSYLTLDTGPDGVSKVVGLRLYQPDLGAPTALATTTFEIAKTAPVTGAPTPRSLYVVLQEKQAVFSHPFWTTFTAGAPPAQLAANVVTQVTMMLADTEAWRMPFLVDHATAIAALETSLAAAIGPAAPSPTVAAYAGAVAALSALTAAPRPFYVAGDLYALTAALDATTRIAQVLMS